MPRRTIKFTRNALRVFGVQFSGCKNVAFHPKPGVRCLGIASFVLRGKRELFGYKIVVVDERHQASDEELCKCMQSLCMKPNS